jgi:hypothetical protein
VTVAVEVPGEASDNRCASFVDTRVHRGHHASSGRGRRRLQIAPARVRARRTQCDWPSFLDDESSSWAAPPDPLAEVLSLSAVEPPLWPPMVASWLEGLDFGLREGLKRCLRGMGPSSYASSAKGLAAWLNRFALGFDPVQYVTHMHVSVWSRVY